MLKLVIFDMTRLHMIDLTSASWPALLEIGVVSRQWHDKGFEHNPGREIKQDPQCDGEGQGGQGPIADGKGKGKGDR